MTKVDMPAPHVMKILFIYLGSTSGKIEERGKKKPPVAISVFWLSLKIANLLHITGKNIIDLYK